MVAGGHLTPDPIESIYSGVVSIRSLRLVIFLAKLNNLEVWGADIGNAYLEARTKEKLYVVAGPEFEELDRHILVIYKALYGLKSSGLSWSQKIHDIMLDMGFSPCNNPYPLDYSSTCTTYGGIDMPAEEFYQVRTTNLNRPPNVSTITPRKPTTAPPTDRPTARRSPGPIFLPANIYKLLSDVAIKELKKHNATTRSTPPPKRAVNTHDTDSHSDPPPLKLPQVIQPSRFPCRP